MSTEHDENGRKFLALYEGVVLDNKDPRNLGRVKLRVPGVVDESGWSFPLGLGGGKKARGIFFPPDVGSDVGVWFVQGDPDVPRYVGGHWGHTGEGRETPGPVGREEMPPEDAVKVKAIETERYELVIDERDGKEAFRIRDKKTDDMIEFDGKNFGMTISVTSALIIKCTGAVAIDAATVTINGRAVLPTGKSIA